jgi:hypothetical protein
MFGEWLGRLRPRRPGSAIACRIRVEPLEERAVPAAFDFAGHGAFAPPPVAPVAVPLPQAVDFTAAPLLSGFDAILTARVRAIHALGRELGNRPDAFIKVGDSITAASTFLAPLGSPLYNPADPGVAGPFAALAPTVQFFRSPVGPGGQNSFNRTSLAARPGATVFTALASVQTEINAVRPSFAVIMLGTNDLAFTPPAMFQVGLSMLVQQLTAGGVVPILSTIPDVTFAGGVLRPKVFEYNQIIDQVAAQNQIPLINYWRALQGLPASGLTADGVHPNAYLGGAAFTPLGLQFGMNVRNALTLQALTAVRTVLAAS